MAKDAEKQARDQADKEKEEKLKQWLAERARIRCRLVQDF